jgi:hypothetical protein
MPCDGNEVISIKVEKATGIQEKDPLLITLPVINAEHEVSCISWCLLCGTFHKHPKVPAKWFLIHMHVCMKLLYSGREWIEESFLNATYFFAHLFCSHFVKKFL